MIEVEISEGNYKRLQEWAVPLEDALDDVLERVLDAAGTPPAALPAARGVAARPSSSPPRRRGRLKKLPQGEYRKPILEVLYALGGSGSMPEVLERVEEKVADRLHPADNELLNSGSEYRWRNTAAWERFKMVEDGLIASGSPRGRWELTDKGKAEAELLAG